MGSSHKMLSALSPQSDDHRILVRVTRIWESINKRNGVPLHTNIILLDEEGNLMMAVIRNNQKEVFLPTIKEQEVYSIANIKVVPGPNLYRTVDAEHVINFFYRTKIERHPDNGIIPQYKFELKAFDDVQSLVGNVRLFIDVIGLVKSYGRVETRSNGAKKIDIVLTNIRNKTMLVTLWEDKANKFLESLSTAAAGAAFVVITGLLAKKYSDAASLSSSDATRCYLNIDYAPLNDLKDALIAAGGKTNALLPPPTAGHFVSPAGNNVPEMTIASVLDLEIAPGTNATHCLCKAKIIAVLSGNGWYYSCCPKCARTVREIEGKFHCVNCNEEPATVQQRFRLVVRVQDASGTTTVTLFNKEAEQLVAVPLTKILAEQEQTSPIQGLPPVVSNIIGKECIFQLKITPYNIKHGCEEYTVNRVSELTAADSDRNSPLAFTGNNPERSENPNKKQKVA